jgi:hypothetical protein
MEVMKDKMPGETEATVLHRLHEGTSSLLYYQSLSVRYSRNTLS